MPIKNSINNQSTGFTVGSTGDLTITSGNINLSTTSATSGIVNVNSTRFIHAYGTSNTFLGSSAGNFTTTATQATAIGASAGNNLSTGGNSVYVGYQAGNTVSGGNENVVIGSQAFASANASQNVVIGYRSGYLSTGFTACTLVGKFTLDKANTGLYNLMLGYGSGTNYTGTESSNICLHSDGVLGDNNTLRIGQSTGTGNREIQNTYIQGRVNLPGQPSFFAYCNAVQNTGTGGGGGPLIQIFPDVDFNVGSHYNATTGLFTAPVDGKYLFGAQLLVGGITGAMNRGELYFVVSSTPARGAITNQVNPGACQFASYYTFSGTYQVDLVQGQTVEIQLYISGGTNVCTLEGVAGNNRRAYFYGHLLS